MASFDKSYYDILNRYISISEQRYQVIDTESGNVISSMDQLPPGVSPTPSAPSAPKPKNRAEAMTAAMGYKPRVAPMNQAQLDQQAAAKSSIDANAPTTPEPAAASTTASTAGNTSAAPSQEELDLFKKIHGSTYNPNSSMDKAKFSQLQSAGQQVGGYKDTEKVRNAAYAQQYSNQPELAAAYAKKAGVQPNTKVAATPVGVTPGSPINPAGSTSTPAAKPTTPTTPEMAVGVPTGTTTQQFDARRAAQTGVAQPNATAVTSTPVSPASKPAVTSTPPSTPRFKNRSDAMTAARKGTNKPTA